MNTQNLSHFKDPLFEGFDQSDSQKRSPRRKYSRTQLKETEWASLSTTRYLVLGVAAVVMGGLGFVLYQANARIEKLGTQLASNEAQLGQVSEKLATSQLHIEQLTEGLSESESKLQNQNRELGRYKTLYTDLKEDQQQHNRELQALTVQKANQSEVAALKTETSQIKENVTQVSASVGSLQEQSATHSQQLADTKGRIDETSSQLAGLKASVEANAGEIATVKRSLEREYYNFELQKRGSYMKIFNVALRLRDVHFKRRQFDLDLLAENKTIRKRNQAVNEPIYFYLDNQNKPYEIVVTRVDEKFVVGYLSVPKT